MPKNASINAGGFRIYDWPGGDTPLNQKYDACEPTNLLSVTSIKTLAGENYRLVRWKVSNVTSLAMGTRKKTVIGPRGGVSEKWMPDGEFPGEFVTRMLATEGRQKDLEELRRWLNATADSPRDIAAVRGSVVHKMIEMGLPMSVIDEDVIRTRMAAQWIEEGRKVPLAFTQDDFNFVYNAMLRYWDMREHVPFVILAQEPQVYNLRAGYAGSVDVLLWFLGHWGVNEDGEVTFTPLEGYEPGTAEGQKALAALQKRANLGKITAAIVLDIGGVVTVGDWKTSKGVYTSHVIQTIAYMASEFVALDGLIDERLSDLFAMARLGMVIHIRPDKWAVDLFEFRQDVLRAFLGSVAYARLLAFHEEPDGLFAYSMTGGAGLEGSEFDDDSE